MTQTILSKLNLVPRACDPFGHRLLTKVSRRKNTGRAVTVIICATFKFVMSIFIAPTYYISFAKLNTISPMLKGRVSGLCVACAYYCFHTGSLQQIAIKLFSLMYLHFEELQSNILTDRDIATGGASSTSYPGPYLRSPPPPRCENTLAKAGHVSPTF